MEVEDLPPIAPSKISIGGWGMFFLVISRVCIAYSMRFPPKYKDFQQPKPQPISISLPICRKFYYV